MADASAAPRGDHIPVLLYHSVSDSPHHAIAGFSTGVAEFASHVRAIVESGREAIAFGELAARLDAGDSALLDNVVCVTFDDGWDDNLAAARVLADAGVPATFFVTSGFVDHHSMLTTAELREMAELPGVEIGAHSVSHPYLDELDDEALYHEVRASRQWLRGALGSEVTTFAYPHGAHGPRVRRAVIDAGYGSAAAVKNAISHAGDDVFAVARWTVTDRHGAEDIRAVLAGERGERAWSGERLRTRAFRYYRRMRRSLRNLGGDEGGGRRADHDYPIDDDGRRNPAEHEFFRDQETDAGGGDGGGGE